MMPAQFEVGYGAVKRAYRRWATFIQLDRKYKATEFKALYYEIEQDLTEGQLRGALFDDERFPSLFDELPILERGADLPPIALVDLKWEKQWLNSNVRDPVARLLLAFIWKQGDFPKVRHVVAGLRGAGLESSVMYQFGRHLRDPLIEPIFDQHTSRQRLVALALDGPGEDLGFRSFCERVLKVSKDLGNEQHLRDYLIWWNAKVAPRLPTREDLSDRGNAVLWSDRIMFVLGKAAKLLAEQPIREERSQERKKQRNQSQAVR